MRLRFLALVFLLVCAVLSPSLRGQHQTDTFSPVIIDGQLPYEIELVPYELGDTPLPSLHSFAKAQWDGKWLMIGGRTNGLHAFTQNGFENFPLAFRNREVWVIDPTNGESWRRSLDEPEANLSVHTVDSLAVTNNQFHQSGDRLYMTGGYGFRTDDDFTTFDALTSIDIPGLIEWTQGSPGMASDYIHQIHDPVFRVTGGAMLELDGRTHLVFGQDFQGPYTPFGNGVYTHQVRSFTITDDEEGLAFQDVTMSEPQDAYRRRDLNVIPIVRSGDHESLESAIVALSGVFTEAGGAWSVPVEIDANGVPTMADPNAENTFRQAMNTYHSAKVGFYSESSGNMHSVLFGGISLHRYDREAEMLRQSNQLPFINQITSIVIDDQGDYEQHLLPVEFPEVYDDDTGNRLRLGTNAEFMVADGIATYGNGVLQMDALRESTTIGYIFGGIAADQPNRGNTAASGRIFRVVYHPVLLGDFNDSGTVDVEDIDLLSAEIQKPAPDLAFDIDASGLVNVNDLNFLVTDVMGTWIGDSDLNDEFNSDDLVNVFIAGQYNDGVSDNSTWATGDWNADGEFDEGDLVSAFIDGGYNVGPRPTLAVPEPGLSVWGIGALLLILARGTIAPTRR